MIFARFGFIGLILFGPIPAYSASEYRDFTPAEYDLSQYQVTQGEYRHGDATIRVVQAKKIKNTDQSPHTCRAWVEVTAGSGISFRRYFDDIDAATVSFGIFVPKTQEVSPYFVLVKSGDNDGRLYLVNRHGNVLDISGGTYFIAPNKRYLFSQSTSNPAALTVIDIKSEKIVYSSKTLPLIHSWHVKKHAIFFTESTSHEHRGVAKQGMGNWYDFLDHKFVRHELTRNYLDESKPLNFDFDPRTYENCSVAIGNAFNPAKPDPEMPLIHKAP